MSIAQFELGHSEATINSPLSFGPQSDEESHNKNEGVISNPSSGGDKHSLLQLFQHNAAFFQFLAIMGVVDNHNQFKVWFKILRVLLFFGLLLLFVVFILEMAASDTTNAASTKLVAIYVGVFCQNLLIIPTLFSIISSMKAERETLDVKYLDFYRIAIDYAFQRGKIFALILFLFTIVFLCILSSDFVKDDVSSIIFTLVLFLSSVVIGNFYLAGIFTILLVEQRFSYLVMLDTKASITNHELIDERYLMIREDMIRRDSSLPINSLLSCALLNTIIVIILFFATSASAETNGNILFGLGETVFYLTYFGRHIILLIWYLYEISLVNEIYALMISELSRKQWFELESRRWSLYIAMKEFPAGATIFFMRPSREELLAQIGSLAFAVGLAIFWAIVFA